MIKKTVPILASSALAVSGAFAVTAPQAFAEFTSTASVTNNSVKAGTVVVKLVDALGAAQTSPIVSLTGALPAMSTKSYAVHVKNAGNLGAAVTVHSAALTPSGAATLNDVLVATVKNGAGTTLYSGTVSGLSVVLASVTAGQTVDLTLELTWPDLPAVDDNPYQDASLSFTLTADATQLAG